jgi:protein associated with RNAse G/E
MKNNYITIHAYKHNGTLYRAWEDSKVLEENEDRIILMNDKVKVTEVDGRKWKTKEPAIIFFYKDKWFNIIVQFKEKGVFFYCNIASPYIVEEKTLKYIDYDLDLRVFPDGSYNILDQSEYDYHKQEMNYPKEMDIITNDAMEELINMCVNKIGPFDKKELEKYFSK